MTTELKLALADMDRDGQLDVVIANHQGDSVSILLRRPEGQPVSNFNGPFAARLPCPDPREGSSICW